MRGRKSLRSYSVHGSMPWLTSLVFALICAGLAYPDRAQAQSNGQQGSNVAQRQGKSGKQLPRFVSLRASRVNLRRGPGTEYPTAWVFRRAGMPVEVVEEYDTWRQVKDAEGTTGWVLNTLLSKRRTALILPWTVKPNQERQLVSLMSRASRNAATVVQVEAGVIANIIKCDGRWCEVHVQDFRGYLAQRDLWGVYPDEVVR